MIATTKIKMDLSQPDRLPEVHLNQDDRYSREVDMVLYSNGLPFSLPQDCTAVIRYTKPDGKDGTYDTMPDGSPAWRVRDNVLTLRLAPQVCSTPGAVTLMATLFSGGGELSCFALCLRVLARPGGIRDSREYINITGFLPQPAQAQVGQCLKVTWVDEYGRITGLETGEADGLPGVSAEDEGAFLRVVDGVWAVTTLEQAEEVSF